MFEHYLNYLMIVEKLLSAVRVKFFGNLIHIQIRRVSCNKLSPRIELDLPRHIGEDRDSEWQLLTHNWSLGQVYPPQLLFYKKRSGDHHQYILIDAIIWDCIAQFVEIKIGSHHQYFLNPLDAPCSRQTDCLSGHKSHWNTCKIVAHKLGIPTKPW